MTTAALVRALAESRADAAHLRDLVARMEEENERLCAQVAAAAQHRRWMEWRHSDGAGMSSKAIWSTLTGLPDRDGDRGWLPADAGDFAWCVRVVDMFGWRARLGEVAARFPAWAPVVDVWDDLVTALARGERDLIRRFFDRLHGFQP